MVPQPSSSHTLPIISRCSVYPAHKSNLPNLKLSVSDLPMLSCHYIQKGGFFQQPPFPISQLILHLKFSLSHALTHFPPLAGRLITDANGYVYITCNDAGVDFIHAHGSHLCLQDFMGSTDGHLPAAVNGFFACDGMVSYKGHFGPILAVQLTELADGVFIACAVNHAVADGTSFWNFFNTFAEINRNGGKRIISKAPDFSRDSVLISPAVLQLPDGGPKVTFDEDAPLRERIFRFSRESIRRLKAQVNSKRGNNFSDGIDLAELIGKYSYDQLKHSDADGKLMPFSGYANHSSTAEISSFQSLCALLWRGITRARNLSESKITTFRMAVNCRHRLEPKLAATYFGNAIQSIPTYAAAGDVLGQDLRWCAEELNKNVVAHGDGMVRKYVVAWEREPRCFPLGNFDGAMITIGSSPRFPMYENDFGWGKPVAVRSGRANKFDGKISAFPGREGNGSVDLEVVLDPVTMAGLESDLEFMAYVSHSGY